MKQVRQVQKFKKTKKINNGFPQVKGKAGGGITDG